MAARRHKLETDLRRGRKYLQARSAWTRENDQETRSGEFSCLAQAGERPWYQLRILQPLNREVLEKIAARRRGFRRAAGSRTRLPFSSGAPGEGKRR